MKTWSLFKPVFSETIPVLQSRRTYLAIRKNRCLVSLPKTLFLDPTPSPSSTQDPTRSKNLQLICSQQATPPPSAKNRNQIACSPQKPRSRTAYSPLLWKTRSPSRIPSSGPPQPPTTPSTTMLRPRRLPCFQGRLPRIRCWKGRVLSNRQNQECQYLWMLSHQWVLPICSNRLRHSWTQLLNHSFRWTQPHQAVACSEKPVQHPQVCSVQHLHSKRVRVPSL